MNTDVTHLSISALFQRVKLVLSKPKGCWKIIAQEHVSSRDLILSLLLPLLIFGAVCSIVGRQIFGIYVHFLDTWHPSLLEDMFVHGIEVLFAVGTIFASSLALKALAPHFGGRSDSVRALSLIVHAMLPLTLYKIIYLLPVLYIILLAVLLISHFLYMLYLGSPSMLGVPESQRLTFVGGAVSIMILIVVVSAFIYSAISPGTPPGRLLI